MAKESKDVEIKSRVTKRMRQQLGRIAERRGESMSLILREAILEYLAKHGSGYASDFAMKKPPFSGLINPNG